MILPSSPALVPQPDQPTVGSAFLRGLVYVADRSAPGSAVWTRRAALVRSLVRLPDRVDPGIGA